MQGKTADEIAQLAQNLYTQYQQLASQGAPAAPPAPPTPPPGGGLQAPNPQLIYDDPARYQREYDAYQDARLQQRLDAALGSYAQPIVTQQHGLARHASQTGAYADIWRRWAPEIDLEASKFPVQNRSLELYDEIARIVRANHLDELAMERAQEMLASGGVGTERGGGGVGSPQPTVDELDSAWDSGHPFFENAKEQKLTKESIRDHCKRLGIPVAEYVKNATLGEVITSKHGFERRSS